MKKNIITLLFLTTVFFGVSAQPTDWSSFTSSKPNTYKPTSNTFKGSSGTIKAFTDTYMDVQNFTSFDYPKDFGYILSETSNISNLELNYGHKYKKTKLGLSFKTNFIISDSYFESTGDSSTSRSGLNPSLVGSVFLGFKNHGFSYTQGYYASVYNDYEFKDVMVDGKIDNIHVDTQSNVSNVDYKLSWGGSFETQKMYLKPIVSLLLHYIQDYKYSNETHSIVEINSSFKTSETTVGEIMGLAGATFDIKPNNNFHHEIGFVANGGYKAKKVRPQTIDYSHHEPEVVMDGTIIGFDTDYKLTYSYEDKLQLAMKTGISTQFLPFKQYEPSEKETVAKFFHMEFSPYLNIGCVYNVKPDTFSFTLGSEIVLPTISYTKVMNKNGKKMATSTSSSIFQTNFNAGINWNFNKHVGMDASMTLPVSPNFADGFKLSIGISLQK